MPEPLKFIKFKHSYNAGDLIASLPGIKHFCEQTQAKAIIYQRIGLRADYDHNKKHPTVDESGQQVSMNKSMFERLKPLIEYQDYVQEFAEWKGEKVDCDFDFTRFDKRMPLQLGPIHRWPFLVFPQLECEIRSKWLEVQPYENNNKIIVNRTFRYNNVYTDYFFLKEFQSDICFVGTNDERNKFCKDFNLDLPLWYVDDFLELARVIAGCRFFLGNQSMCWHIAEALGVRRILEVDPEFPNTFPILKNGYSFVAQASLEYRFNELIKETECEAKNPNNYERLQDLLLKKAAEM